MAKGAYLSRYLIIINKIKSHPYCTLEEISATLDSKIDYLRSVNEDMKMGRSNRTIERDFKEIKIIHELDIKYCHKNRGYYISNPDRGNNDFLDALENFEIMHTIQSTAEARPYIHLENKRAAGADNFNFILDAIKKNKVIQFKHQKYWEDTKSEREVLPLALKEFKYRWYLIALEKDKNAIRTFGIDRISDIAMMNKSYAIPNEIQVQDLFKNSFGIIYKEGAPEEILLSFSPFQAKYIKSLLLHSSQELVSETDKECIFKYTMHVTFDLVQEILSLGKEVKVLSPPSLRKEVKTALKAALENYE